MAILRIIGQLALSGYQEKIKGWGLKYVSVQLTMSTYKLVSGPSMHCWTLEMVSKELNKECYSVHLHLDLCRHHDVSTWTHREPAGKKCMQSPRQQAYAQP
jgi:hypothetical protein